MQNIESKTALGFDQNVGALICYLGNLICSFGLIYSIIVLVTDKTNKLPRFHAWQSILCSIFGLIFGLIIGIGSLVGTLIDSQIGFPIVSLLVGLVALVIAFGFLIVYILAAVKAFKGEIYRIPVLGGFADKWSQPV